ncbi:MAG: SDR family oxidoreductase [Pseudomonadota bacterium]
MNAHMFDLTGKVAIVTGGGGGLGLGMAEALAGLGCAVSIWGRNEAKLADAVRGLEASSESPIAAETCDVSDAAAIDAAFARTLDRFGRVDGMIANAGVAAPPKPSEERGADEWRSLFAANVDGVAYSFQSTTRHFKARAAEGDPGGRLIATSSVASIMGAARAEHYGASKGAVNAMVRALAVELARYGVTANAILPGYAESDMTGPLLANDKFVAATLPRIPMRRFGRPSDYGGIAAYLMSDAAAYHTGDSFVIDGGYTLF